MSRQFTVESAARTCSRPFDCRSSSLFSIYAGLMPSGRVPISNHICGYANSWGKPVLGSEGNRMGRNGNPEKEMYTSILGHG